MTNADARGPAGQRRLYYGWIIVLACNGVSCITWGVAIFNQGVFGKRVDECRAGRDLDLYFSFVFSRL